MFHRTLAGFAVLAGSALLAGQAFAQFGPSGLPNPDLIAHANTFQPPKLTDYAAKLASQPDMTGAWRPMDPKGAGAGPSWDPVHTFWPPQPVAGEQGFGPVPGTYIRDIPYNAEYRKKYQELIKETTEGKSRDNFAACFPYGVPRMIGDTPVSFDIIQAPEVMFWSNNYGRTERKIFMDGRQHPAGAEPSYSGHSIGRWEGDTLVVDTVNMVGGYFDESPAPYSDKIHLIERMRLIDTNILEDQITVIDPVTMDKPWVVTRYYRRGPGFSPGSRFARQPAARPPPGAPPPSSPFAPPAGTTIVRDFLDLNDRPCVPNVRMDENGFQVMMLPAEIEAAAAKAKAASPPK